MRKTNLSEYQCILELSNEKIALGTIDGHIFIYDLDILSETYIKFVNKVSAHKLSVNCLVELTDSRLASCSSDSFIKIWNIKINDITDREKLYFKADHHWNVYGYTEGYRLITEMFNWSIKNEENEFN